MKVIIFTPTYNEKENIVKLINEILKLYPEYEILVVDDNSPDGTGDIIKEKFSQLLQKFTLHLIVRETNRGRGLAGIEGYRRTISLGADIIVEMDADLSHSPVYISDIIKEISNYDVVVGSRYIKDGGDEERNILRKFVSWFARTYIRIILKVPLKDPTSGFRALKKDVLIKILPLLKASDPFIVTEVFYYAKLYNFTFKEVPIFFLKRYSGTSKLNLKILFKYLFKVLNLKFRKF